MTPSAPKRRCEVEGCRAWAQHGQSLCSAHMRSRTLRERAPLILPLLSAVSAAGAEPPLDDVALIDEELRKLLSARAFFESWAKELRVEAGTRGLSPAQFLRAWNDSSTRIIQLLRARRELSGNQNGEFGALMNSVYDELEKKMPST